MQEESISWELTQVTGEWRTFVVHEVRGGEGGVELFAQIAKFNESAEVYPGYFEEVLQSAIKPFGYERLTIDCMGVPTSALRAITSDASGLLLILILDGVDNKWPEWKWRLYGSYQLIINTEGGEAEGKRIIESASIGDIRIGINPMSPNIPGERFLQMQLSEARKKLAARLAKARIPYRQGEKAW